VLLAVSTLLVGNTVKRERLIDGAGLTKGDRLYDRDVLHAMRYGAAAAYFDNTPRL
jgi:hypothetical protein